MSSSVQNSHGLFFFRALYTVSEGRESSTKAAEGARHSLYAKSEPEYAGFNWEERGRAVRRYVKTLFKCGVVVIVGSSAGWFGYDWMSRNNYEQLKSAMERPKFVFDWDPKRYTDINYNEVEKDIGRREIILVYISTHHLV